MYINPTQLQINKVQIHSLLNFEQVVIFLKLDVDTDCI